MLIFLGPTLLFLTTLALVIIRLVRRRFRFGWLAAFVAAWGALLTILVLRFQLPSSSALPGWGATIPFPTPPAFSADSLSWTYALALSCLLLAGLLVAPAWPDFQNSMGLPWGLAYFGFALLAVLADNILTVALAWAAIDIAEAVLALRWGAAAGARARVIWTFSVRLAAVALVLLVYVLSANAASAGGYEILVIAAIALRLAVLPTEPAERAGPYMQGGIGVGLQLASASASLALLSRLKLAGLASPGKEVFLVITAGAALYSGWMWLRSSDAPSSRKSWMLALTFLAIGSALLDNPVGSAAWGICLVLVGGSLFYHSARQVWLNRAVWIGAWCLSALPFSLSGGSWTMGAGAAIWVLPAFVVAQAFLIAGFLQHATQTTSRLPIDTQPGWIRGTYVAGIGLLLLFEVGLGLWGWDGAMQTQSWLAGVIAAPLGLLIFWGRSRLASVEAFPGGGLHRGTAQSVSLLQRGFSGMREALRYLTSGITSLFEGDAGMMWGLLFLVLIVSLIVGRSP